MPWDNTMPSDLSDGVTVDEGDLDPVLRNILYLRNERDMIAVKSVDETVNNTATMQDDDHLFLTVAANSVYFGEMELIPSSTSVANFKTVFTGPVGMSGISQGFRTSLNDDGFFGIGLTTVLTFTGFTGSGSEYIRLFFRMTTGVNAGVLRLQWAQNTATAVNTVLRAGSYLRLRLLD